MASDLTEFASARVATQASRSIRRARDEFAFLDEVLRGEN